MTTAHRPTWKAAVGQASEGGWGAGGARSTAVSGLDMAAHTKLKVRHGHQTVSADRRQELLKESLLKLEQAEKKASVGKRPVSQAMEEGGRLLLLKQTAEVDDEAIAKKYDDEDASDDDDSDSGGWKDIDNHVHDEDGDDLDASSSDDDDSDDDDSDDDEEALQAELAKIRAEREAAKQKQAQEEEAEQESKLEEAALLGNPLLAQDGAATTGKLKRKWNDDVVFRNQAKGEPGIKKRFINDTVRNDFHKRFLNKFIR